MTSLGELSLGQEANMGLGDLTLNQAPTPDFSFYVNPKVTESIKSTLDSVNPMPGIENMNLMPDVSGLIASVKASVGNYLSPLIAKTSGLVQTLTPYAVPISVGIGAGLVFGYYIGKKHGKLKGILGGLAVGTTTSLATGLAVGAVPLAVGAGAAGVGGLAWVMKEMAKKTPATATATA